MFDAGVKSLSASREYKTRLSFNDITKTPQRARPASLSLTNVSIALVSATSPAGLVAPSVFCVPDFGCADGASFAAFSLCLVCPPNIRTDSKAVTVNSARSEYQYAGRLMCFVPGVGAADE